MVLGQMLFNDYAMILTWGITSSHVFTSTVENPELIAWLTSSWAPNLNHSVRSLRESCSVSTLLSWMDRKKPDKDISSR